MKKWRLIFIAESVVQGRSEVRAGRGSCPPLEERSDNAHELLCETRWSQKYKSIAIFNKHFDEIINGLGIISTEGNAAARKTAYQLHCAATKSVFIICVTLIAKYSGILEPVANALQSKAVDMYTCVNHIKRIISVIENHRGNADSESQTILDIAHRTATAIGTDLQIPRIACRQQHRSNHPAESLCKFWKRSVIIPYLDSLISALDQRFSNEHLPAFSLMSIHPCSMLNMSLVDFKEKSQDFCQYYDLPLFEHEAELWYKLWKDKGIEREGLEKLDFTDVLKEADTFFPATKKAILISLAQPCTTSNIERYTGKLSKKKKMKL
jgi:hypothetical protein